MGEALSAAHDGLADGGLPIGAVLAHGDGSVRGRGFNQAHRGGDRTRHAETVALSATPIGPDDRDLVLVTTLEPCAMCAGAAMQLAVDTVVFGARDPLNGTVGRIVPPTAGPTQLPRYVGGVRAADSVGLFRQWLAAHASDDGPRAAFVRQWLATQGPS